MEKWIPYVMMSMAAFGVLIQWLNRKNVTTKEAQEAVARHVVELLRADPNSPFYSQADGRQLEACIENLEEDIKDQKKDITDLRREMQEGLRQCHNRIDIVVGGHHA